MIASHKYRILVTTSVCDISEDGHRTSFTCIPVPLNYYPPLDASKIDWNALSGRNLFDDSPSEGFVQSDNKLQAGDDEIDTKSDEITTLKENTKKVKNNEKFPQLTNEDLIIFEVEHNKGGITDEINPIPKFVSISDNEDDNSEDSRSGYQSSSSCRFSSLSFESFYDSDEQQSAFDQQKCFTSNVQHLHFNKGN